MGEVLYNDGKTAVYDYEWGESVPDESIKTLLSINPNAPIPEKSIEQLIACFAIHNLINLHEMSDADKQDMANAADTAALDMLGFWTVGRLVEKPAFSYGDNLSRGRVACSVDGVRKSASLVADGFQYLAKLHLLSNGDFRHEDVAPTTTSIKGMALRLDTVMPNYFMQAILETRLNTPARFDAASVADYGDGRSFVVAVEVPFNNVGKYPFPHLEEKYRLANDEREWKAVAVAAIVPSLLSYMTANAYGIEVGTLTLRRNSNTLVDMFADSLMAGKVRACPRCGRPVLMPRESSKPFCSANCQQRYREHALKMFERGAAEQDVIAAFPCISAKTISNWYL